jgi:hypothetical protein
MGRMRSTHGRNQKCVQNFGRKTSLEDNIKKDFKDIGGENSEYGNKSSGSIKGELFLRQLGDYCLHKEDSVSVKIIGNSSLWNFAHPRVNSSPYKYSPTHPVL